MWQEKYKAKSGRLREEAPIPMLDQPEFQPTTRFTGLSDIYAKYRPSYPPAVIDTILNRCGLGESGLLVDVGCGTGISSRLFAERGVRVIGLEPNADMRARAVAHLAAKGVPVPEYRAGRAEATGLPDGCAYVVLAAQAFHWFAADAALREFHRTLKPGGWVALLWNERDETEPFTAAYGAVIRTLPDTAAVEGPRHNAGDPLLAHPLFERGERLAFTNEQRLDEDGFLGRSFSASYAPRDPATSERFAQALRALFASWQKDGFVTVRYETSLYLAQRRDA
jgi:SAM-dependent methyltransferase